MAIVKKVRTDRILIGRILHGGDLLGEISDICTREQVRLGRVEAIGSVTRARLGYFHQEAKEYRHFVLNEPLEITALKGNVSLKEGSTFLHAHVSFSNDKGTCYGGHLAPGTVVYACEFIIEVFDGPAFEREYDGETGLHLWNVEEEIP